MRKTARILFLLSAPLLLASCFDMNEEVWIHRDGSGRAEIDYRIPPSALLLVGGAAGLENKIRPIFDTEPTLHLELLEIVPEGKDTRIRIHASSDSLLSLFDIQDNPALKNLPEGSADFAGTFQVRIKGLDIDFHRHIDLPKALGLAALAIGRESRETRRLRYIVHLPGPVGTTNATRVENGGRTLIWDHSLGQALAAPITTDFRARMPLPWGWILTVLVLLAALTAFLFRRRAARKRGTAAYRETASS